MIHIHKKTKWGDPVRVDVLSSIGKLVDFEFLQTRRCLSCNKEWARTYR